jgi:hypothetical protein
MKDNKEYHCSKLWNKMNRIKQLIENEQTMKNTYCLFQVKFITEYTNVQHIIITQI